MSPAPEPPDQMSSTLSGVPVWVTPGVVTRIDISSPASLARGVLGASATVVDPGDDPMFRLVHARDPRGGRQVYRYDSATGQDDRSETAGTAQPSVELVRR